MLNRPRLAIATGWKVVGILLAWVLAASATAPTGWYVAGSKPAEYNSGVDAQAMHDGHLSACLKAKNPEVDGFGTLMQDFQAERYAGKRLRFSAAVKSEGVQNWAGLWMRVDKASGGTPLAFDNMQDRPIKGTTDWQGYAVVLDVPQDATGIFFGVLLNGPGSVWMSDVKVDVVGTDVPTTGKTNAARPKEPTNLNFED
jgi:hypothetical protein